LLNPDGRAIAQRRPAREPDHARHVDEIEKHSRERTYALKKSIAQVLGEQRLHEFREHDRVGYQEDHAGDQDEDEKGHSFLLCRAGYRPSRRPVYEGRWRQNGCDGPAFGCLRGLRSMCY
jgi:hypothetical protein